MTNKELFLKAMNDRYACKVFDQNRKIPKEDLEYILECGRLSPSSFGIEQWKFIVIRNQEIKDKIQKVSWNQKQVGTCSDLIVILARKDVRSSDPYVQKQLKRYGLPEDKYNGLLKLYADWVDGRDDHTLELWSEKQAYIAAANMMTGAAFIGIDSCPIEGFDYKEVDKILGIDTNVFQSALVLPFGYRADKPKKKHRLTLDEVTDYIL
ncbi:NAD(P)H-dependent oxidoreductase [Hydrogenimonas thermophila]|uniref:NAD(P)H-dependent oxidoreductase n=1 Tax=Hydrogenimonas thermophila TaxID=223786 RepID=UPI0029374220|nr:NAD(P)H-dependent oxidoreductase [Hydrogenimonas thermophila]WOE68764.1 NAD(P)H-dependent oxidoreductase [Hydrogenimonas thermophila]WOE71274.1 NAD(P)H-dependent oxidoreductase [Hydrogenimonas thermophila]